MNVPALLTTLRKRDRDIAIEMGIKVAQLNRRQKKIQAPSDESEVKIREFVENHISELQKFLNGFIEKTTSVEEVVVEESEPVIQQVGEPEIKKPKITKRSLGKWGKN
ncbi:MAG TPA: hypothetical protein PLW93_03815 [Candidatus Absconditabacterales bacterium]|nr:hypothetical protein [Candidatus Absconditabacterales bacterium]